MALDFVAGCLAGNGPQNDKNNLNESKINYSETIKLNSS